MMSRPLPHPGLQTHHFIKQRRDSRKGSGGGPTPGRPPADHGRPSGGQESRCGPDREAGRPHTEEMPQQHDPGCQKDRAADMSQGSGNTELKEGFRKHGAGRGTDGDSAVVDRGSLATYAGYVKVWCVGQPVRPFPSRTSLTQSVIERRPADLWPAPMKHAGL